MKDEDADFFGNGWFCGILVLIFITLKLAEIGTVSTWSWLWVLSPLWIPLALACSIAAIIGFIFLLVFIISDFIKNNRNN